MTNAPHCLDLALLSEVLRPSLQHLEIRKCNYLTDPMGIEHKYIKKMLQTDNKGNSNRRFQTAQNERTCAMEESTVIYIFCQFKRWQYDIYGTNPSTQKSKPSRPKLVKSQKITAQKLNAHINCITILVKVTLNNSINWYHKSKLQTRTTSITHSWSTMSKTLNHQLIRERIHKISNTQNCRGVLQIEAHRKTRY